MWSSKWYSILCLILPDNSKHIFSCTNSLYKIFNEALSSEITMFDDQSCLSTPVYLVQSLCNSADFLLVIVCLFFLTTVIKPLHNISYFLSKPILHHTSFGIDLQLSNKSSRYHIPHSHIFLLKTGFIVCLSLTFFVHPLHFLHKEPIF